MAKLLHSLTGNTKRAQKVFKNTILSKDTRFLGSHQIRHGFGNYLRGSSKTSCSQRLSLVLSGMHGRCGWILVGAEVLHSSRIARRTREWGVATSSASVVRGCRTVAVAPELMNYFFFLSFSLRGRHSFGYVMFVTAISLLSCPSTAKARGGTAHVYIIFCLTLSSRKNTRRIRRGFRSYLRGSPKTSCSRLSSLVLSGLHVQRSWTVLLGQWSYSQVFMQGGRGSGAWLPVVPRV